MSSSCTCTVTKTERQENPDCPVHFPRSVAPTADPVEAALADALTGATAAGQWEVVATLARELQARREARANVVQLDVERVKRGPARR